MGLKVVIPVAGIGTRLRPHTLSIPKALINVAGKKIIDYIISTLEGLEVEDFVFIIGHLGGKIEEYIKHSYTKIRCSFLPQHHPEGLAHAIKMAEPKISRNDEILIILGDLIFFGDIVNYIKNLDKADGTLAVMSVKDPQKYGVVTLENNGEYIKEVVEKPIHPPSNLVIAGIYYFKEFGKLIDSIDYLISNNIRTKNEYQLTDAIMNMIKLGAKIKVFPIEEVYDCGSKEKLIETNNILLKKFHYTYKSRINIKNSVIIPPVYISPNATVERSIIGPFVSIYDGVQIRDSIIRESIVEEGASVSGMIIEKSLIGKESYVEEAFRELNIGPHSEYKKIGEKTL